MGLVVAAVEGSKHVPNEMRRPLGGTAPRLSPYEGYICRGFKGWLHSELEGTNGLGRPYGIGFYRVGR